jgi:molybdopterin molybdotransferase
VITLEEARRIIDEQVTALPAVPVELSAARGRVLREAITSDGYYPSADRSMMDGYAIATDDKSERFRVVAEITPGIEPAITIGQGECARIFTGAIIPAGASRVIMQEETQRDGEWMIPTQRTAKRFIRSRGEEAKPGDILLENRAMLDPADLAILAQVGVTAPKVSPTPTITHIATGDELIDPSAKPQAGQIRDTNSTLIRALAEQCDAEVQAQSRIGDDLRALVAFASAHPANLLLISGGASVGEHDFGARALRELGYAIHFDRVNLRPGKPLTFATRSDSVAFVIPGNPVSHFVCFHVAVRLAIECMQARLPKWSFFSAELGGNESLRSDPRDTFWPAKVFVTNDGKFIANPKRWSSSGDTFSLAGTDALIRIQTEVHPGASVPTLLLELPR